MNNPKLLETISLTWAYYNRGQALQDTVLLMYAEDLADLPVEKVCAGYSQYRRNPKNRAFPLPAQIREIVVPEEHISAEDMAREIAARVVGAVSAHGWNNGKAAEAFIGPVGWSAVQRAGGWSNLCENLGRSLNPTTFQAQIRDQITANLRYGPGVLDEAIAIPERTKRPNLELASAGDILRRITSELDPEESA